MHNDWNGWPEVILPSNRPHLPAGIKRGMVWDIYLKAQIPPCRQWRCACSAACHQSHSILRSGFGLFAIQAEGPQWQLDLPQQLHLQCSSPPQRRWIIGRSRSSWKLSWLRRSSWSAPLISPSSALVALSPIWSISLPSRAAWVSGLHRFTIPSCGSSAPDTRKTCDRISHTSSIQQLENRALVCALAFSLGKSVDGIKVSPEPLMSLTSASPCRSRQRELRNVRGGRSLFKRVLIAIDVVILFIPLASREVNEVEETFLRHCLINRRIEPAHPYNIGVGSPLAFRSSAANTANWGSVSSRAWWETMASFVTSKGFLMSRSLSGMKTNLVLTPVPSCFSRFSLIRPISGEMHCARSSKNRQQSAIIWR